MSRHVGRLLVDLPAALEQPVEATPVAPHRYTWSREEPEPKDATVKAWRATVPYQPGDVVWVQVSEGVAKRALVIRLHAHYDRWHTRMAMFKVCFETKAGKWSRQWNYTWPGFIQRGYAVAGLAPDVVLE